ncbi:hypothetical protein SUGI_1162070 [Cryptomeria japonica]|nr:hypothetical protein SUGI_1162070 [Cryptomeria japonica]
MFLLIAQAEKLSVCREIVIAAAGKRVYQSREKAMHVFINELFCNRGICFTLSSYIISKIGGSGMDMRRKERTLSGPCE